MASSLALVISQLNCSILKVLENECNRKLEKIDAQIADLSQNMATEEETINSIELAKKLAEFVQLNEDYANILEQAEGNPAVAKRMIDDMDTRKRRFDDAMKLVVSLIKEQTTTK